MSVTTTVILASKPQVFKSCKPDTRYIVISINAETGRVEVFETGKIKLAREHFSLKGDPAKWRGIQIIQIDVNGGAK